MLISLNTLCSDIDICALYTRKFFLIKLLKTSNESQVVFSVQHSTRIQTDINCSYIDNEDREEKQKPIKNRSINSINRRTFVIGAVEAYNAITKRFGRIIKFKRNCRSNFENEISPTNCPFNTHVPSVLFVLYLRKHIFVALSFSTRCSCWLHANFKSKDFHTDFIPHWIIIKRSNSFKNYFILPFCNGDWTTMVGEKFR